MRKLYIIIAFLLAGPYSYSQGIVFQEGKFEEILAKVKTTGQAVFVDVYTDWCVPCKKLSAEVFPDSSLGNYFNNQFVSYKLNAEKGEGVALAKRYGISAYPTMIWIDGEGNLIQKVMGFKSAPKLMEAGKTAVEELKNPLALRFLQPLYQQKKNDPAYLQSLIAALAKQKMPYHYVLQEYIGMVSKQESMNEETLDLLVKFIGETTYGDPIHSYIEKHKAIALSKGEKEKVETINRLYDGIGMNTMKLAASTKDEAYLNRFLQHYTQRPERMFDSPLDHTIDFYHKIKDWKKYQAKVRPYLDSIHKSINIAEVQKKDESGYLAFKEKVKNNERNINPTLLERVVESNRHGYSNGIGKRVIYLTQAYSEQFEDASSRKLAVKWIEKVMKMNPSNPDFVAAYATVLYLNGQRKEALTCMQKAFDLPQSNERSKELLQKKMDQMKAGLPLNG